jgi:hypothetical protein
MPTYIWRGSTTAGTTGQNWGFTGNWLNSAFAGATAFPLGGDTVVFGASAISACLVGGLSGGYWIGYTSGDSGAAGNITVRIDNRYGVTHPNNLIQLGYSFGSLTGGLNLKVSQLYIGTTGNGAEISINNAPASAYSVAHMDGPSGTFYASGAWKNVVMSRGGLHTQNLTAEDIFVEGIRGSTAYYNSTEGFGVGKIVINSGTNLDSLVISAKATQEPLTINTVTKNTIINGMGVTNAGHTFTTIVQNIRPAGLQKSFNRITQTFKYERS